MKFDDILVQLGEFGLYQKRIYLIICIPAISVGCYMMLLVFLMHTPEHRCKIPGYGNDTYAIQSEYHRHLINVTIPPDSDPDSIHDYDQCHMYMKDDNSPNNLMKVSCHEWVYDESVFYETFSSKLNLVCDDALKTSHATMIFYCGVLAGDLGFGVLADFIGRKKTLVLSAAIQFSAAVGVAFAPEYYSFVILEFIVGAACHGVFIAACVLGVEFVGPSKRVMTGIPIHMFFTIGLVYIAGVGYFLRHWQHIQLACACPCIIYLFYWWIIPESPRWLVAKSKFADAEIIIQKAAKVNKAKIPEKMIDSDTIETAKSEKIWSLFTHRVLFIRTMILLFNWVVIALMYYGVTMHVGRIGGDFYLNQFILALVEFPASILSMVFLDRIGRKKVHYISMFSGGIALLCTIFPVLYGGDSLQPLTLTLSMIGKCGASAAFGVIYVFSSELYPTVIRNGGMGMSSCIGRFGSMSAPYVAQSGDLVTGKFGQALPMVIIGGTSALAGFLTVFLPETLHRKLPESIMDGIKFATKEQIKIEKEAHINNGFVSDEIKLKQVEKL